jgi:photosystem II stability/assembly factor-like uncharacterized protein
MKLVSGLVLLALGIAAEAVAGERVWTTNGPGPTREGQIALDPLRPGMVYADAVAQIARSTDNGLSWVKFSLESDSLNPLSAYPLAAFGGVVYAALNRGNTGTSFDIVVYRSLDAGEHWQSWLPLGSLLRVTLLIDPNRPSTLYRVDTAESVVSPAFDTIYRSSDAGQTWTTITPGGTSLGRFGLLVDPKNSGTLFAAYSPSNPTPTLPLGPAFFESTDSGTSWTLNSTSVGYSTALAIDPVTTSILHVGSASGLLRSLDSGATFALVNPGLALSQILVDPVRTNRLFALSSSGVIFSTETPSVSWSPLGAGLEGVTPISLAIDNSGSFLHAGSIQGAYDYQILPDPGELHLNAAHPFVVTLSATDPHTGATAPGVATQVNDLWGYFSIRAITNNPGNPEVFVKLLDGTAINGEYWYFYGGLTNLEYTLTVTDATTGKQKTYTKPAGSECGGSDTEAFTP